MKKSSYRIDILPLIALPGGTRSFSYRHETALPFGTLVLVPFGRFPVRGIVTASAPLSSRHPFASKMKPLREIVSEALITPDQYRFAETVSAEYAAPLGRTLIHFLPPPRAKRPQAEARTLPIADTQPLRGEEKRLFATFTKRSSGGTDSPAPGFDVFVRLLAKLAARLKKKGAPHQTLVLVPDVLPSFLLAQALRSIVPAEKTALITSGISDSAYRIDWEKVRAGKASVIIGTRQALFAPFSNLRHIIITSPDANSYKQWDMSPRFDARRSALLLAAIHHASLSRVHSAPSVALPEIALPPIGPVEIVNMRLERYKKRYSPISLPLKDRLAAWRREKRPAILIATYAGTSRFSLCTQCKALFRCPDCAYPLVPEKSGTYHCKNCTYRSGVFPRCPTCGHIGFKNIGYGTERLETELRRAFPGSRIVRLDTPPKSRVTLIKAADILQKASFDFLIATPSLLFAPPLPADPLVAIIDADGFLAFPDFRAEEQLLQTLSRTRALAGQAPVVIQTFRPEEKSLQAFVTGATASHLQAIGTERATLSFPPFGRLLRIEVLRDSAETALRDAKRIKDDLVIAFGSMKNVVVADTGKSYRVRKKYQALILAKLPANTFPFPPKISSFLRTLPRDTFPDIDPLTFY